MESKFNVMRTADELCYNNPGSRCISFQTLSMFSKDLHIKRKL